MRRRPTTAFPSNILSTSFRRTSLTTTTSGPSLAVKASPLAPSWRICPAASRKWRPFHLHATAIPHDLNHSWQAAHLAYDDGKMDGFLWAEWPAALRFYWKGELPGVDPEDIVPAEENPQKAKEDLASANRGPADGAQRAEAKPLPKPAEIFPKPAPRKWARAAWASRPSFPLRHGCSTPSRITTGTKSPTTGNTPDATPSATTSFPRWPAPASRTISTPSPPSPAGWSTIPARASPGPSGVYTFPTMAELLQNSGQTLEVLR